MVKSGQKKVRSRVTTSPPTDVLEEFESESDETRVSEAKCQEKLNDARVHQRSYLDLSYPLSLSSAKAPTTTTTTTLLTSVPRNVLEALTRDDEGRSSSVRHLWCTRQALHTLSPDLSQCGLETLGFGKNALSSIPQSLFFQQHRLSSSLQRLHLEHNHLTNIPESIRHCHELREIFLDHNALVEVPPGVLHCRKLQRLGLSHNHITSVPDTIDRLLRLSELDLDYNDVDALPETLGRISSLRVLGLEGNCLERDVEPYGHDWTQWLPRLQILRLTGNRKRGFEVVDPESGEIVPHINTPVRCSYMSRCFVDILRDIHRLMFCGYS